MLDALDVTLETFEYAVDHPHTVSLMELWAVFS